MKLDLKDNNPYQSVVNEIAKWCEANNSYLSEFIVWLRTREGEIHFLLEFLGLDNSSQPSWYEGGDVELLGFCPIDEVVIPEEYRC